MPKITEVQIVPVRPCDGLVAFASCVIDNSIHLGGIGVYTKPEGGYRLTFPTRKSGSSSYPIYYPINRPTTDILTQEVISKLENVMKTYDRHNIAGPKRA
jgi:DNA-binding cell septation regulator SpoVG